MRFSTDSGSDDSLMTEKHQKLFNFLQTEALKASHDQRVTADQGFGAEVFSLNQLSEQSFSHFLSQSCQG